MSTFVHYKITTAVATTIHAKDTVLPSTDYEGGNVTIDGDSVITKEAPTAVTITNIDASGDFCSINLYLDDGTNNYYILSKHILPSPGTLVLEKPELNYDTSIYDLKFLLGSVSSGEQVDIKVQY